MFSGHRRLVVIITLILLIVNIVYIAVIFNPQVTATHIGMTSSARKDITALSSKVIDLYAYKGVVYGIYDREYVGYKLFAYSDHFVFEVIISNILDYNQPRILQVTDFGIFLSIGSVVMYNLQGRWIQSFPNPVTEEFTKFNSYYSFWVFQTSNALYKASVIRPIGISTKDQEINVLNIEGWKLSKDSDMSNGLGTADLDQTIKMKNIKGKGIINLDLHKTILSEKLDVLLENELKDNVQISLVQFKISSNYFKQVKMENFTTSKAVSNYYIVSSNVLTEQVPIGQKLQYLFTNLATNQIVTYFLPQYTDLSLHIKHIDSSLIIYGGSSLSNQQQAILTTVPCQNNHLSIEDQLTNTELHDITMIYSVTYSGKTLYMVADKTGDSKHQLIAFEGAIIPSVFLQDIDPGIQLNLFGVLIILVYSPVEYYKSKKRQSNTAELFPVFNSET